MSTPAVFCLMALATLMATTPSIYGRKSCNKLHAVFYLQEHFFFTYGRWYRVEGFSVSSAEQGIHTVFTGPFQDNVVSHISMTAAVGIPNRDAYIEFSGKVLGTLSSESVIGLSWLHAAAREFGKNSNYERIDAAAKAETNQIVFFSGCEYVVIDTLSGKTLAHSNLEEAGLPCHVDAAMRSPKQQGEVWVIKGHNVYLWTRGDTRVRVQDISELMPFLAPLNLCRK